MSKQINIKITGDGSSANRALQDTGKSIDGFSSKASKAFKGVGISSIALGGLIGFGLSKAFSEVSQSVGSAIKRLDTLNNYPRVMHNLGISSIESQRSIGVLSQKLIGLPTTLDEASLAVQRFTSANGNIQASTGIYLALNNAILAGGAPMELQRTAMEQLSQAYAKGKPDIMEFRAMMSAMPAQMKQIATAMGLASTAELQQQLTTGKISMDDFVTAVFRLNKQGINGLGSFEEQARNSTNGVGTAFANLRNAIVRSVTAIMNAIGQTNIASFINGISKAILAVTPYIVAFVRVVVTAINAIKALFGGSSASSNGAKSLSNNLKTASGGASGVASGLGNAGKALKGANSEAKKLKGTLSSIDEMNVLNEQPKASSGGSSGGGGANGGGGGSHDLSGVKIDGWDNQANKLTDKAKDLADKMIKILSGIFDFNKIGKSLKRFVDDLRNGFKPVGEVFTDAWNNYLRPILSWTGNSLVPAVLNSIGGALNFLGQVLKAIYFTYLKPFLDNFLVPLAKFSGGVIVNVLNGIGDALRKMAQNKAVVQLVATGVMAIGVAIGTVKIVKFSQNIASAIRQLKLARQAGLSFGTALQIAGSDVGGFIGKLALLSGDSLTSVSLGVNQTKSAFSLLFEKLGSFGGIVSLMKSSIGLLVGAFRGLFGLIMANPITAFIGVLALLITKSKSLQSVLKGLADGVLKPINSLLKVVGDALGWLGDRVADAIKLFTDGGKSFNDFMDFLNNALPIIKPVTDALKGLGGAVSGVLSWLGGLGQAIGDAFGGMDTEKVKAEALKDTQDKLADAVRGVKTAEEELHNQRLGQIDGQIAFNQAVKDQEQAQRQLAEAEKATGLSFSELKNKMDNGSLAYKNMTEEQRKVVDAGLRVQQSNEKVAVSQDKLKKATQDAEDATKKQKEAVDKLIVQSAVERAVNDVKTGKYKTVAEAIENLKRKGIEYKDANGKNLKISGDDVNRYVDKVRGKLQEHDGNFQKTARAVKGNFFDDLKRNFDGGVHTIQKFASDAGRGLQDFVNGCKEKGKRSFEKIQEGFSNARSKFSEVGRNIWGGIKSGLGNLASSMTGIFSGAVNSVKRMLGIHSPSKVFMGFGVNINEGLIGGLQKTKNKVDDTFSSLTDGFNGSLQFDIATPQADSLKFNTEQEISTRLTNSNAFSQGLDLKTETSDNDRMNHIVVKIGEDTVVDKIINGINDRTTLSGYKELII